LGISPVFPNMDQSCSASNIQSCDLAMSPLLLNASECADPFLCRRSLGFRWPSLQHSCTVWVGSKTLDALGRAVQFLPFPPGAW
jgi:hypothetical protein